MTVEQYLNQILSKYAPKSLANYSPDLALLRNRLASWSNGCKGELLESGSRAKGTAISIASDVDYLISLSSDCNESSGGIKSIFAELCNMLSSFNYKYRIQNVSARININGLQVDITPARKQPSYTNYHWLFLNKSQTRQQTNIKIHIDDVSKSGRLNEIKILKIWRDLHGIDFPSIYLEYLLIDHILYNKSKSLENLGGNAWFVFQELAKDSNNPLFVRIVDPANSNNILSDLLTNAEKNRIISVAKNSIKNNIWRDVVW